MEKKLLKLMAVFGLAGIASACSNTMSLSDSLSGFPEPPRIESKDGVLKATLTAESQPITVGGVTVMSNVYNGLFVPPTLVVRPGDTMLVKLNNFISMQSNLHYHGMNVSPRGNSDNVFLSIPSGNTFDYEIKIPSDHPKGMFYYHPHPHGLTESQIGGGMSGALIVDGLLDPFPNLKHITQHVMMLKDLQIVDGKVQSPPDSGNATQRTLNGAINPTLTIRPGEIQLWRVGNIGADIYYNLRLGGHTLYEIARDGNLHNQLVAYEQIMLPTSARSEFLVVGGPPGEYVFETTAIQMGPQGDTYPKTTLATLVSSIAIASNDGTTSEPKMLPQPPPAQEVSSASSAAIASNSETGPKFPLPLKFPPVQDLRTQRRCCSRTFDFSETPDGSQFCINNEQYDMALTNTTVQLGCVEEWTVNNCTGENHVFHIHQLDFQVIEKNGLPVDFIGRQDTVSLDFRTSCECDSEGNCKNCTCPTKGDMRGSTKILIPFTNPVIAGKFVYHCHIGEHEDNGMMQNIEVIKMPLPAICAPGTPNSIARSTLTPANRAVCNISPSHMH